MKKSLSVPATLLIATAATFIAAGCSSRVAQQQRRCVDSKGNWIEDRNCDATYTGTRIPGSYWMYGGAAAALGSRVTGGSRTMDPNAHVTDSAGRTIQRGGFNRSSSSGTRSGGFFGG